MELRSRAQGRWHGILTHLGVDPVYLRNRNGPCPACGGKDRFRWDDKNGDGTFYCNGGGDPVYGSGFDLVMHLDQCDFAAAAKQVEEALGGKRQEIRRCPPPKPKPKTNNLALEIWNRVDTPPFVEFDAPFTCEPDPDGYRVDTHPYAKLKGITWAAGAARGHVSGRVVGTNADCVIVPMRSPSGRLKGVECIGAPVWDDERKKYSTPKQTFGSKGCLILGNTLDKKLPVYITEGWADAVSIWRQMGNVIACAVFGNTKRQDFYAEGFEKHNPEREYILVRDA